MASPRSRRLTALIVIGAVLTALLTRVPDQRNASAFDFNFVGRHLAARAEDVGEHRRCLFQLFGFWNGAL